jgi:hypothetical protein
MNLSKAAANRKWSHDRLRLCLQWRSHFPGDRKIINMWSDLSQFVAFSWRGLRKGPRISRNEMMNSFHCYGFLCYIISSLYLRIYSLEIGFNPCHAFLPIQSIVRCIGVMRFEPGHEYWVTILLTREFEHKSSESKSWSTRGQMHSGNPSVARLLNDFVEMSAPVRDICFRMLSWFSDLTPFQSYLHLCKWGTNLTSFAPFVSRWRRFWRGKLLDQSPGHLEKCSPLFNFVAWMCHESSHPLGR